MFVIRERLYAPPVERSGHSLCTISENIILKNVFCKEEITIVSF